MTLFIVKDATGNLLAKDMSWTRDPKAELFSTPHKDIALNQLLELNAQNIQLRAQVLACEQDAKKRPIVADESELAQAQS